MGELPRFTRQVIYAGGPSERTLCLVGDVDGDGVPEVVIGARAPRGELYWLDQGEDGEWRRYTIDDDCGPLEAGGAFLRLTPEGRFGLVAAHDYRSDLVLLWEPGADPRERWTRRLLYQLPGRGSHDQLAADIDGDGREELYFWNASQKLLFSARVPDDPAVSPWPEVSIIGSGVGEEGLAAADLDGDGRLELIAGQSWCRPRREGLWERHAFAEGYSSPRLAVADFDGDGKPEIILAEGDASLYAHRPGRLVRLRPGREAEALWETEVLSEALLDPHTLDVADFDGDGRPDLLVAELGDPNGRHAHPPGVRVFHNQQGELRETLIEAGISVHEGRAIRLQGRTGIVGKPFQIVAPDPQAHRETAVDCIHL